LTWSAHEDVLAHATTCGVLGDIEAALLSAYDLTPPPKVRLRPSSIVEGELRKTGWSKRKVWAPDGFQTRDSFDGWKEYSDDAGDRFAVAVEVEWIWERLYADLLKFWRANRGGQASFGIEVLYGPDMFRYVVHHVFALTQDVFKDVRVVFCALDAPDLEEPGRFHRRRRSSSRGGLSQLKSSS
jgi:hypothetical protein